MAELQILKETIVHLFHSTLQPLKQAPSQVLRLGGPTTFYGGNIFVSLLCFNKKFCGHNKFGGPFFRMLPWLRACAQVVDFYEVCRKNI